MALLPARLAVKAAVAVAEKAEAKVVAKAAEKAAVAKAVAKAAEKAAVAKVVGKAEEAKAVDKAAVAEDEDALDKGDENTTFEPVNLRTFDL